MQLSEWFEAGCPYAEGVELYNRIGSDAGLKVLLNFGETRYNARKLYEALDAIREEQNAQVQAEKEAELIEEREQQQADPRLSPLYRQRRVLHDNLEHTPSQSDRYRMARKILALTDKIERILGVLPEEKPKAYSLPDDPVALIRLRNNNRSYISKRHNRERHPGEVERRRKENIEIEKILKEHGETGQAQ